MLLKEMSNRAWTSWSISISAFHSSQKLGLGVWALLFWGWVFCFVLFCFVLPDSTLSLQATRELVREAIPLPFPPALYLNAQGVVCTH